MQQSLHTRTHVHPLSRTYRTMSYGDIAQVAKCNASTASLAPKMPLTSVRCSIN